MNYLNFFKDWSIRTRLICAFALTVLVPSTTIVAISYTNADSQIKSEHVTTADNTLQLVNDDISSLISHKKDQINYLATYITASKLINPEETLYRFFDEYLALNTDSLITYVGTSDGEMLRRPFFNYDSTYNPLERPWYQEAVKHAGETVITDPYISSSTGELVITLSRQLEDGSGVVGIDLSIQTISDIANSINIGENGFFTILDHNENEITGGLPKEITGGLTPKEYLTTNKQFTNITHINEESNWQVIATIDNSDAQKAALSTLLLNVTILGISVILSAIVIYLIIISIMRPLRRLTTSANQISQGDLTERVKITTSDELGQLGDTFNVMRDNLHELITHVNESSSGVLKASEQLAESSSLTIEATTESAQALQNVAENNELQLTGNEKNNTALQQISENVSDIAESSVNTTALTKVAIQNATTGNDAVEKTVVQMQAISNVVTSSDEKIQALSERITQIDTIVDVINGISNQTNLLALNASIEAARAGENGKGFAVVADEVRNLAESSKQSTEQISQLIQTIQHEAGLLVTFMKTATADVAKGLQLTDDSAMKFHEILQSLEAVAPNMNHISKTSTEMKNSVNDATTTATSLMMQAKENAAASEQVAAASEEIHASMEEMNASAANLQRMADQLQSLVKKFKI